MPRAPAPPRQQGAGPASELRTDSAAPSQASGPGLAGRPGPPPGRVAVNRDSLRRRGGRHGFVCTDSEPRLEMPRAGPGRAPGTRRGESEPYLSPYPSPTGPLRFAEPEIRRAAAAGCRLPAAGCRPANLDRERETESGPGPAPPGAQSLSPSLSLRVSLSLPAGPPSLPPPPLPQPPPLCPRGGSDNKTRMSLPPRGTL